MANEPIVTLIPRGGAGEVPGSLHDYFINDELIRIDSGLRPQNFNSDIRCLKVIGNKDLQDFLDNLLVRPDIDPLPNGDKVPELKHLLLSHVHLDHVGAVPYFLRKYRHATVYATAITADISKIQWSSTPTIAERNSEVPLFNEDDVDFALSRIKIVNPGERIRINEHLEIEPVEAGHLPGAVSFVFYWKGKPIGLHTGDITLRNKQRLVADAPEIRFDCLRWLTIESTRITEQNPPRYVEEGRFKEFLQESYYGKGMWIRIPTFAIGRLQEMFVLCKEACPDADIWIDGQGRDVSAILSRYSDGILSDVEEHFVKDGSHRRAIINSIKPNIALMPSAMRFGGTSRQYIEYGCIKSNHLFISPGYRDQRSPEYAFFAAPRMSVFRFGAKDMPKLCRTETFNFTSHCDGDDVLEVQARTNPDRTILVHGDKERMESFVGNHPSNGFIVAENDKPIEV